MFALAVHLSIVIYLALVYILVDAVTEVFDLNPPIKFYDYTYTIIKWILAWSSLIALSIIWGFLWTGKVT